MSVAASAGNGIVIDPTAHVSPDARWIGANCSILDGAGIGRGAVVAAGSVVRGEVGACEIWGGVPARRLGRRAGHGLTINP